MGANPSARFYWNDYLNDEKVAASSLAAQGLWMRMLCMMAGAQPLGYLMLGQRPMEIEDLARLCGTSEEQVSELLAELERNGVFSRTRKKIIYSRRLVRYKKSSQTNAENAREGVSRKPRKRDGKFSVAGDDASDTTSDGASATSSPSILLSSILPQNPSDSSSYVWEGRVGRLRRADYDRWRESCPRLDDVAFRRELIKADAYYAENPPKGGKWFFAFCRWLEKANAAAPEPTASKATPHSRLVAGSPEWRRAYECE